MNNYKSIYLPNHPNAVKDGTITEHRLVASKMLGRPLTSEEVVHHINEIKDDNRPENLMVFRTSRDHRAYHDGHKLIDNGDGTYSTDIRDSLSKEELIELLKRHNGVMSYSAEEIGFSPTTIQCWVSKYNINPDDYSDKIKLSKEELIDLLKQYNGNMAEIARKLENICKDTISDWCKKFGIDNKDYYVPTFTKEDLDELLKKHKGNMTAISREKDISITAVSNWCKKYNLNPNDYSDKVKLSKEELIELLKKHNGNMSAIAKEVGVDNSTIGDWCKKFEIDNKDYYDHPVPIVPTKDKLLKDLFDNNYVLAHTSILYNVYPTTVAKWKNKYNIIIPTKDQLLESIYRNGNNITLISMDFNINNNIVLDLCIKYNINLGVYFI